MKEFIAWALRLWPILAAVGGIAFIISGWVIKHDFGTLSPKDKFYSIIPILQEMDEYLRTLAKKEAKKVIDFNEYEKVNNVINKDIYRIKTPKPKTIKGLKKSINKLENSIQETLIDEVASIRSGIGILEPVSSFLDSKGFGLKQQRETDNKYTHLALQLQNYRNLPLGTEIDDLIGFHITCSEVSANMFLATIRATQCKLKDTNVGFADILSTQSQIAIAQVEKNMKETTQKIRASIGELIRELERNNNSMSQATGEVKGK